MEDKEKQAIVKAALEYIKKSGISNSKFCKLAGINTSYFSSMTNGVFTFKDSRTGNLSNINDRWFFTIARYIGFSAEREYWPTVKTKQFVDIIGKLKTAKEMSKLYTLIGSTGCGKTYSIHRFSREHPAGTYIITCNINDRTDDLIRKIQWAMGTDFKGSKSYLIDRISIELSYGVDSGEKPILIFDEAEYLSMAGILSVKTIYDYLRDMCSIVFAGTSDFDKKIKRLENREGMRQFCSRIEAGKFYLRPIDRSFKEFFAGRNLDKRICEFLCDNALDYRILNDYLEPALREADKRGEPLTMEFFKKMYHLKFEKHVENITPSVKTGNKPLYYKN